MNIEDIVVAGFFTFIGVISGWFISSISTKEIKKDILLNKNYYNISNERIEALNGQWKGIGYQEIAPNGVPLELPVFANLKVIDGYKIKGTLSYVYENEETILESSGNAMDNKYIVITYADKKHNIIRYGTFMFELNSLGNELKGHFVAHAAEMEGLVTGDIILSKIS